MRNGGRIRDRYDLPLTTESPKAADSYVEGIDRFLAQIYGPEEALSEALEVDDGLAVAHAAAALLQMYRMEMEQAKRTAAHAERLAAGATKRELQQVKAIGLMIDGESRRALALIREHLEEFPRDMLMVRLANRLLVLGCSGAGIPNFPDELLGMLQTLKPDYGEDWAFLSQYAFAHHETGRYAEALGYAERSLDIRPDNANAAHSVSHVFFETGDPDGGSDFLGGWLEGYDRRGPFNVHLSWHQALFQLCRRPRREGRFAVRGADQAVGGQEESRLSGRQRLADVADEDLWGRAAGAVGGGTRDRPARGGEPRSGVQGRPRRAGVRRRRIRRRDGPYDRRAAKGR